MISIKDGIISFQGSSQELLKDTISIVYSIRKSMIKDGHVEFVKILDRNILSILAEKLDDNVACFKKLDNEEDHARFVKEYETRKKSSTAEKHNARYLERLASWGFITNEPADRSIVSGGT